jgi:acyl dehydratase
MRTFDSLADLAAITGEVIGHSDWITVDQSTIDRFAEATGDRQWIHTDTARAADGPYGTTIADGYLTLALLPQIWRTTYRLTTPTIGVNYGLNKVRFPAPVPVGSRLRGQTTAVAVDKAAIGATRVTLSTAIEISGADKLACIAETIALYVTESNQLRRGEGTRRRS